jgi:hypothetical protein
MAGQKFEDQLAKLCQTNGDVRRLGPGEGGRRGCLKTLNGSRRIENGGRWRRSRRIENEDLRKRELENWVGRRGHGEDDED